MEERRERSCGGRFPDGGESAAEAEGLGMSDVPDGDTAGSREGEPGMLVSFRES